MQLLRALTNIPSRFLKKDMVHLSACKNYFCSIFCIRLPIIQTHLDQFLLCCPSKVFRSKWSRCYSLTRSPIGSYCTWTENNVGVHIYLQLELHSLWIQKKNLKGKWSLILHFIYKIKQNSRILSCNKNNHPKHETKSADMMLS